MFEIARHYWKKIDKPSEDPVFSCPEGPNIEYFSNCHTPAAVFSQFLDTKIVGNTVLATLATLVRDTNANETSTSVDNEGNTFSLGEQVVQTMVLDY